MTTVLAIDPGSERSAWLFYQPEAEAVGGSCDEDNELLLARILAWCEGRPPFDLVAIEFMSPRGMPTSAQEFETLWWAGRFAQAAWPSRVDRIKRDVVKVHLTGKRNANDSNVRAALIDRFGGIGGKAEAVGVKAKPGPLYGISGDVWAALAVAVTWADQQP